MANFTQAEIEQIQAIINDIDIRMYKDGRTAKDPNDKPIAEGYAMMARLLKERLANDPTLTEVERTEISHVMTWFQGAEKVNRGESAFSVMPSHSPNRL